MKIKLAITFLFLSFVLSSKSQNELSLQTAIQNALSSNLDLKLAQSDAVIAHNNNHIGNAGMLPTVTFNASATPSLTNINQKFTNGTSIEKSGVFSNAVNANIIATYTLYDGSRMFAARNRLEFQDEAAKNTFNSRVQTIVSSVISTYANIVRQQEYLKVLLQLQTLSDQRLILVKQRRDAGLANNTDLYLAQLDLESRNQAVNSQNAIIKNAFTDLNVLMNAPASNTYVLSSFEPSTLSLQKSALDSSVSKNPDVSLAQNQLDIAFQTQREIAAASSPLLRLNGAYNYNISQSQAGFSLYNQSTGPQVGLTLSIPLFTGNVNSVNTKNARVNLEAASVRKERTIQQLNAALEQAWVSYQNALLQINSDTAAVRIAKEYMDLMQQRFNLGQNTIIELKEAQRTFEETNYRLISNQYIAKLAETQLMLLTGMLVKN